MDFLYDQETLSLWLIQYGSLVLFGLLTLGIIALPIPEETLMILAGILIRNGKLLLVPTFLATLLGSICGISVSYLLGRTAGHYLVVRFGKWLGITPKRLEKTEKWFHQFGRWTLLIGYFIPGIRHLTGFSAGLMELRYKVFALFAYLGALLWVSLFLSVGYFCGHYCLSVYDRLELSIETILYGILALVVLVIILYILSVKRGGRS